MTNNHVSPAVLEEYKSRGVLLLQDIVEQDCIEKLQAAIDHNLSHPGPLAKEYPPERGQGRFYTDLFLWLTDADLREFVRNSPLPALAAQLLESSKVNLFYDQVFVKEPGTSNSTPWHQDLPHFPLQGAQVLSFWVALDAVTLESGGLEYVEGSHLWGKHYQPSSFGGPNNYPRDPLLQLMPDIAAMRNELKIAAFDMAPGDVLVFDARIVHGSGGNRRSDVRRRGYSIRYCGDDVTFAPRERTLPLASDPGLTWGSALDCDLFPQVWPRRTSDACNTSERAGG